MYERIVVPLDGSEPAERALPWARTIAARSDGDLRLVHVHTPLRIPTSQAVLGPRVGEALRKLGEDQQEEAAAYLEATGERLKEGATPSYSTALLRGPTAASVARDAQSTNAALIVMAPRDRKALERLRDGSVTEQLARTGPVPVLAIRGEEEGEVEAAGDGDSDGDSDAAANAASERTPGGVPEQAAEEPATEPPECRCILVPLDGTSRCEAALEHAAAMGALFDATVILVRVERPGQWAAQPAATYLDEVADGIHRAGVAVETRVLADRDVVGAVYAMVEETGAGMIVVGSRYRDGLPRLIRGGLAETFLRSSPVPVLVVSGRCVKEGAKGR